MSACFAAMASDYDAPLSILMRALKGRRIQESANDCEGGSDSMLPNKRRRQGTDSALSYCAEIRRGLKNRRGSKARKQSLPGS